MLFKWRRRESNPQSPRFELGRFADLRTAPCFSGRGMESQASSTGFEPAISCVTGRRALQAAPRGHRSCLQWLRWESNRHAASDRPSPGSKPRWSAGCLPEPQWSRMESNHRFLGVDQVSLPLDHGTVFVKWSHRESHPDLQHAKLASSCWTMTPCKRKPWDSNPQAASCRHLFSRQAPHPAGWLPLSSCGGWNRTNMKTFRASHPAVR